LRFARGGEKDEKKVQPERLVCALMAKSWEKTMEFLGEGLSRKRKTMEKKKKEKGKTESFGRGRLSRERKAKRGIKRQTFGQTSRLCKQLAPKGKKLNHKEKRKTSEKKEIGKC